VHLLQDITRAIRACLTAEQVVQVVQQQLDSMNAINLSAALDKLSKLQCEQQLLYAACMQRYAEFAAGDFTRNLSTVVYALCCAPADISQQHQQAVQEFLLPALLAQLADATPQDISTLLSAAAKSCQQLDENVLLQLLDSLFSELQQASAQSLSNVLWAVATMGQQVPAQQLKQLLNAFVGMLQQACPQDVSCALWAVASLGQQVPGQQLQQLLGSLVSNWNRVVPQDVSISMWASARMRHLPKQLLATPGLADMLAAGNTQTIANAAWACAQLG
jgi:hypothetical protein